MKNVIYYFTGTGNSLAIAKKIAADLGECDPGRAKDRDPVTVP